MSLPKVCTSDADVAGIQIVLYHLQHRNDLQVNNAGNSVVSGVWVRNDPHSGKQVQSDIKVTIYCSKLLMDTFWDDKMDVSMQSLFNGFSNEESLAMSKADRSGGFFKLSPDRKYMVKGIFNENVVAAKEMYSAYLDYLESSPSSTLAKIVAVFTTKIGLKSHHYCIMKNAFPHPLSLLPNRTFDIKGRLNRTSDRDSDIKKEMEFLSQYDEENATKLKFRVGQQIRKDVEFLKSQNLFDYSILLGFRDNEVDVGIIDILTPYSFWRGPVGTLKKLVGRSSSGCPPLEYADRMLCFMKDFGFETGWKQLKRKWRSVHRLASFGNIKRQEPESYLDQNQAKIEEN
jgi:hypothetical protein